MQQLVYDDLANSGVPQNVVDLHGLRFLASSETQRLTGLPLGSAYEIPYRNANGVLTGISRIRLLAAKKKMKYYQPIPGIYIYFPIGWNNSDTLLITEGEKKAISAVVHGFSCIGIGGVNMWHDPCETGQPQTPDKCIHPDLLDAIRSKSWKKVIVISDSDGEHNPQVRSAMTCLARAIRMQAKIKAHFLILPEIESEKKIGLDDFLKLKGARELDALLNQSLVPSNGFRYFIPFKKQKDIILKLRVPYFYGDEEIYPAIEEEKIAKKKKKDIPENADQDSTEDVAQEEDGGIYWSPIATPALWYKKTLLVFHVQDSVAIENNFDFPVKEIDIVEGLTDSRRRAEFPLPEDKVTDFVRNCGFGIKFTPFSHEILALEKRSCPKISYGVMSTGWIYLRGYQYYLLPGLTISDPEAPPCVYCQPGTVISDQNYIQSTDEKKALEVAREILSGSSGLCALTAFAFAGALITPLQKTGGNPEPSIIHLGGEGGRGKTSALRFIGSFTGSPHSPRHHTSLIRTWRTSENGLEGPLERVNDAFLMLDELGQASENTDWNSLLYFTANGTGKTRMNRNISMRRSLRWTCNLISTGEKSLLTQISQSIPPEGLMFRVIDLEYDSELFYDKTHLWSFTDSPKMETRIDDALTLATTHYGWVFRKYIEAYMNPTTQKEVNSLYIEILAKLRKELDGDESSSYSRRAKTVALIMTSAALLDSVLNGNKVITNNTGEYARLHLWPAGISDVTKNEVSLLGDEVLTYIGSLHADDIKIGKVPGIFIKDTGHICIVSAGVTHISKVLQLEKARVIQGLKKEFKNKVTWAPEAKITLRAWVSNTPIFLPTAPLGPSLVNDIIDQTEVVS